MNARGQTLLIGIAAGNFDDLPSHSSGPLGDLRSRYAAVAQAGYEAVQGGDPELCAEFHLTLLGSGVIPTAASADRFVSQWSQSGAAAATCIAGFGLESDEQVDGIVEAISSASAKYGLPVYLETHRASITQDAWRTVQLAARHPGVRFNGDFSHWYTGQEMPYGDFEERLRFLGPVFSRTRFLHGRIGNRACMQTPFDSRSESAQDFRRMWQRVFALSALKYPEAELWFCPELLGPTYAYARTFHAMEETDRWIEALNLITFVKDIFLDVNVEIGSR